jgi:hypothetical protein
MNQNITHATIHAAFDAANHGKFKSQGHSRKSIHRNFQ